MKLGKKSYEVAEDFAMTVKRKLTYVTALFMMGIMLFFCAVNVQASETEGESVTASGKWGTNITWTIENGVLTLTGSGAIKSCMDWIEQDGGYEQYCPIAPWMEYAEEITSIQMDDRITAIGDGTFYDLSNAQGKVVFPSGLKTIGMYAFRGCNEFDGTLEFPNTLTKIGDSAFAFFAFNSEKAEELVIPVSVKEIGSSAFAYGNDYKKVYIRNANMVIGDNAFTNAESNVGSIYAKVGSTAEEYATFYDIPFYEWDYQNPVEYYTVTFDSNGGSAVAASQVEIGGKLTRPASPTKANYYFQYWSYNGAAYDFDAPVRRNLKLKAVWSKTNPVEKAPELKINNGALRQVKLMWQERGEDNLLRYDIYLADKADGEYQLIGSAEASADTYQDYVGMNPSKAKCFYKIQAVYDVNGEEQKTPFSNIVSTNGMIWSNLEEYSEDTCYAARLVDDEGNVVEELTLHVGESSPELHLELLYRDGSTDDWRDFATYINDSCGYSKVNIDWYISQVDADDDLTMDRYNVSYAKFLPTADFLGVSYLTDGGSVRIKGKGVTDEDNPSYIFALNQGVATFGICIPITVLPAEEGVEYEYFSEEINAHSTEDTFWESIRTSLKNRETTVYALYTEEAYDTYYEIEIEEGYTYHRSIYDDLEEKGFDFFADREGMKSNDGDYLMEGLSAYQYGDVDVWYYGEEYYGMYMNNIRYYTTKAQEDWMDEQIDKMVNQPGGRFYAYRDASDYEKVEAVYNYVSNKITWVNGSNNGLYHMAYSGLHDGKGTCQSYALLFYRLAKELGISNKVLMGTDAGAHTYNIVKLGSKYYYLDCSAKQFLKGSKNFKTTQLQWKWLDSRFWEGYLDKISETDYGGEERSKIQGIAALSDEQINALDENMLSVTNKMKATYTVSGSSVTVKSSTLQPIYGCTGYLGAGEDTALDSAYYLAMRVKADSRKFTEDGKLTVAYMLEGERVENTYTLENSTLAQGYVDVILKLADENPSVSVAVDFDTNGDDSSYRAQAYSLNINSLKRSADACGLSDVKELSEEGILASSPLIASENAGADVTVTYPAVAYSDTIKVSALPAVTEGNYIALKVEAPATMQGTSYVQNGTTVEASYENGDTVQYVMDDKGTYVKLYAKMDETFLQTITITWAGKEQQKITIKAADNCILETLSAKAKAPKTVKFNGLAKTLYVGQYAVADTTIVKKYEKDEVQLSFATSNSNIISINRVTGEMQALKPGSATITVTAYAPGVVKPVSASAKITVKAITAPASMKTAQLKDTSVTVSWKKNVTAQEMEVYAIPLDTSSMGANAKAWKSAIEATLASLGMDQKKLSSLSAEEREQLQEDIAGELGVASLGNVALGRTDGEQISYQINGLSENTKYVVYIRSIAKTATDEIYSVGAVSNQFTTKTEVLDKVTVTVIDTNGVSMTPEGEEETIAVDMTAGLALPAKLTYQVVQSDAAFTSVSYKSTNAKVVKVDKSGKLTLGSQAGTAQLYVTGKDSSGTLRESEKVTIQVVLTPSALADKKTKMAIGSSMTVKELIGYNKSGTASDMILSKIDFEEALTELETTGCFVITRAVSGKAEDALVTAVELATDTKGKKKNGNSVKIAFKMYGTDALSEGGAAISVKTATIQIQDMAQPKITKVIPMDTSVTVKFKPSASVMEPAGNNHYYLAEIIDKTTGKVVTPASFGVTEEKDSTAKSPVYTCVITGLSAEKDYEVKILAVYDEDGSGADEGRVVSKASAAKKFKTLKRLAAEEDTLAINYISLQELQQNQRNDGAVVDLGETGITLYNNETYILMAQVDELTRVLGTDKLKWTISSSDVKNPASIKAGSDTYQAQLTTMRTGTFTVTVTSTVSKQTVASFKVTVLPYQSNR